MKKLSEISNLIPVIAKSDSLTPEERVAFKKRIKEEIDFHGIKVYPLIDEGAEVVGEGDRIDRALVSQIRVRFTF